MFPYRFFLAFTFFLSSVVCNAQVTGSNTVCVGYMYTFDVNIAGASTYTWTVPANWYGLTGQGTSQINVTCNVSSGPVCVEGFDSNGASMGTQCLIPDLGGAASMGWQLVPTGFNDVCDDINSAIITPMIIPYGAGGGGCVNGCGNGIQHPNLVWGLYLNNQIFVGLIGTTFTVALGHYSAALVDTTSGTDFPQAIEIIDGCGGAVSNYLSIGHINLVAAVTQTPLQACIGDTVLLQGNGTQGSMGGPYWFIYTGLTALTSVNDFSQIQVVVTGVPASFRYFIESTIASGVGNGNVCTAYTDFSVYAMNCNAAATFQSSTQNVCENSCINFTNTSQNATMYQWSFPGATPGSSTNVNPSNICYNSPGNYDVMLIAGNFSQSDTLLMPGYITVIPTPQAGFTATDTSLCQNGCINFTSSSLNATGYQWNFSGGLPASSTSTDPQGICYNSAGDFDVSLISTNGICSDTLNLPNYIHIMVSQQSAFGANPVNFCPGSCTDFTNLSTGATSWQWNFPGATIDTSSMENPAGICYNFAGQYDVQLISSNAGCVDTLLISNYITVFPQPPALSLLYINDTLFSDQGFTFYQWYFNSNIIPGATEYFYLATANGDYNVIATDSNGCEVEAAIFNVLTNVENIFSAEGVDIVPNPFTGKISFQPLHASGEKILITVLNSIGEKLFEKQTSLKNQEVDLSFLAAGLYILSVQSKSDIMLKKIVKM
ncbi:MAG: T9SS type A sorting domain-containing protein [Bacteroidota bacterium]